MRISNTYLAFYKITINTIIISVLIPTHILIVYKSVILITVTHLQHKRFRKNFLFLN